MSEYQVQIPPPPPPPLPGFDLNYSSDCRVGWRCWKLTNSGSFCSWLGWLVMLGSVTNEEYREIQHREWQAAGVCHYWNRAEYHYRHELGEACR